MTAQTLPGRTAAVTGAGRGIGRATAVALARAGVRELALVARSQHELAETADLIASEGTSASIIVADLSNPDNIPRVLDELVHGIGDVDILVNNAATVAPLGDSTVLDVHDILTAFQLNVVAPILLTGGVLPGMLSRGWGRIVNISSGVAGRPENMIGGSTYTATKAALEAQTLAMAAEYTGTGVTLNAYRPGTVDTAMQAWIRSRDPKEIGERLHSRFLTMQKSGALITPEQSAAALINHLNRNETGQIWNVHDQPRTHQPG